MSASWPGNAALGGAGQVSAGNGRASRRAGRGAVSLFALRAGSPHWLNLHVVGVILILVGALGLLPRLGRGQPHFDRLRRWERPGQPRDLDGASAGARPRSYDNQQASVRSTSLPGDSPTLVDDLLSFKHPLP